MRPPRIIDAHHHLWDLERVDYPWLTHDIKADFLFGEYSKIRKNYLPDDMRRQMSGWNVEMTVHVEAERADGEQLKETVWLSEMHDRFRLPNAIIGHVWLADTDVEDQLHRHMQYPVFRGVRSKPRTAKSAREAHLTGPATMSDPQWLKGLKVLEKLGLIYDFRVPYFNLKEGAELPGLCPGLQFIVNHAGLPRDRSSEGLAIWRDGMKALAAHPNVAMKVSGISLPGMAWTAQTQGPVIRETIDIFGIDRCMFASNFPPDNCVTEFAPMMEAFQEVMAPFTDDERDRFFYANAKRYYRPVP
jgi:predicted TIM-barrel fold metal-dependent hydrolase